MSELAQAEARVQSQEGLFYELLEQMPENMRLYQELVAKQHSAYDAMQSHRLKLADIDINSRPSSHPEETAYVALGLYVMDRRHGAIQAEMRELDLTGGWPKLWGLRGREVRVEPLGDIFKIKTNTDGNTCGTRQQTCERQTRRTENGSCRAGNPGESQRRRP